MLIVKAVPLSFRYIMAGPKWMTVQLLLEIELNIPTTSCFESAHHVSLTPLVWRYLVHSNDVH